MIQHTRRDNYAHIFNQGVDRRQIFLTREDYERFKAYLYILNDTESIRPGNVIARDGGGSAYAHARGEPLVKISAFSLLPTHFHLLLAPAIDGGVGRFMQKILTGYTMYFNARTLRSGTLFASGYKSHSVEYGEEKYARAYIHITPAQFFHADWQGNGFASIPASLNKIATYPYASLNEYHTKQCVIVSPPEGSVTPDGEMRLLTKVRKSWTPAF
jgi:putative transposase